MKLKPDKYKSFIENLPNAFACHQIVTDDQGTPVDYIFIEINKAFEKMTGFKRKSIIGKKVTDVLPEIKKTDFDWIDIYGKVALDRQSLSFEQYFKPLKRWYEVTAYSDEQGFFITVFKEIAGLEEELLALKSFNESIVQNIAEGIVITNNAGEITFVNPAMVQMLGYAAEEYLGKHWKFMIFRKDYQIADEADSRRRDGKADRYELVLKHKNGSRIPVQISGRPNYDSKTGDIVGTLALFVNITDRLKVEEALRESEMRSQALIGAIPDLLYRFNREGVYLEAVVKDEAILHPRVRSLYRQNSLVGKPVTEVLPAQIAEEIKSAISKTLARGKLKVLEYSYMVNGALHYFEARLAPIGTNEVVSIVRDVTERKKYEIELQKISFNDQLTGLYNRHYFESELKRLSLSRYYPIALISADLDGLKLVNDTLGHAEGDRYLQAGADLLKGALRASDVLARVGGDEFAIILPHTDRDSAEELVARLRARIDQYNSQQQEMPVGISIGLAVSLTRESSLEETFKEVDNAMYEDKLKRGQLARTRIVDSLVRTLSTRKNLGEGNSAQIEELANLFGQHLPLGEKEYENLQLLAKVYDLGKVNMPDQLVHSKLKEKEGELTTAERDTIRRHPEIGYRIASSSPGHSRVADLILHHHENYDGSGYPLGLKGNDIAFECRIMAIIIAYSAMTNHRPYANKLKANEALEELKRCGGTQFDPQLVEEFVALLSSNPK